MKLLEVCVDSLASARAAIRGGADRLELCSALLAGGLTPYVHLLEQIREESNIPIRCLMRPRPGDFLYTPEEIDLMVRQIPVLKAAGADGFVIGCLTPQGLVDTTAMKPLVDAADGAGLTLHRCFDVCLSYADAILACNDLGIDTILTSGGAASCLKGMDDLGEILELKDVLCGPEILVGAGVNAAAIRTIRDRFPALESFHMSGKIEIESKMEFRVEGVPMGLPGLDEWHIQQTDEKAVRDAVTALHAPICKN